jgi:hypothetical protein
VFVVSDRLVEARFGDEGGSGAVGIVAGAAVVDGIPKSLISGDSYRGRLRGGRLLAVLTDSLCPLLSARRTPAGVWDHGGLRRSDGVGMTRTNSSRISTRR